MKRWPRATCLSRLEKERLASEALTIALISALWLALTTTESTAGTTSDTAVLALLLLRVGDDIGQVAQAHAATFLDRPLDPFALIAGRQGAAALFGEGAVGQGVGLAINALLVQLYQPELLTTGPAAKVGLSMQPRFQLRRISSRARFSTSSLVMFSHCTNSLIRATSRSRSFSWSSSVGNSSDTAEGFPWQMPFSRADAALISSSGMATSISFVRRLMG